MTCLGLTAFLYQFSVQIKLGWQRPKDVTVWRLFGSPQNLLLFCYFGTILSGDVHNKKKKILSHLLLVGVLRSHPKRQIKD